MMLRSVYKLALLLKVSWILTSVAYKKLQIKRTTWSSSSTNTPEWVLHEKKTGEKGEKAIGDGSFSNIFPLTNT